MKHCRKGLHAQDVQKGGLRGGDVGTAWPPGCCVVLACVRHIWRIRCTKFRPGQVAFSEVLNYGRSGSTFLCVTPRGHHCVSGYSFRKRCWSTSNVRRMRQSRGPAITHMMVWTMT